MKRRLLFTILLLSFLPQGSRAFNMSPKPQDRKIDERHISEFRYIITSNEVDERFTTHSRSVGVLMDKDAFTEENLTKLYKLISKRFPEPNWLYVWVNTSLWQVDTPEEANLGRFSERGYDPHDDQYPSALLMRVNDNEFFRYSPEGPPYFKMKTVILKGVDPFNSKKH